MQLNADSKIMILGQIVVQKSSQNVAPKSIQNLDQTISQNVVQKSIKNVCTYVAKVTKTVIEAASKAATSSPLSPSVGTYVMRSANFWSFFDQFLSKFFYYFLPFFEMLLKLAEIMIKCGI